MKFETLDALTVHSIGGGWGLEIEDGGHTECVAVIRGTDIPKLALGDTSSVPVRWETSSKVRTRLLQYGDIVMEVSGGSAATRQHTGRALFVTLEILEKLGGRVIPASFCRLLRLDSKKIDPKYISYQIANMHLTEEIALFENQSTGISNFQFTRFLGSIYPLTNDLQTQSSIANFFDSIDRQIITLQQINSSLESIAKAIFQSWFVDFDPVRVKLDGGKPIGLDEATANLFPDTFQESELGRIPKGWRAGTLSEGFNITMGQSPPGNTYNELGDGLPFYQGCTDFGFRFPKRRIYCTAPNRTAKDKDTLVSVRAPVGDINMAKEECCIGRGVAAVRHKSGASSFTYHAIANLYPDFAKFEAEGTVFGSINKDSFEKLPFVIPPAEIVSAFERIAEPLDEQIRILVDQSHTLANIRNALLPKLLNGELSVESLKS